MLNKTVKIAKRVGKRIRELRNIKGPSQEALADLADFERAYFWKLENGKVNCTLETLVRVAEALEVDIAELFQKPTGRAKKMNKAKG